MSFFFNALLVLLVLLNFAALASSRMTAMIHLTAFQGVVLGLLPIIEEFQHLNWTLVGLGIATVLIKALLIPGLMHRAMREVHIRREIEPLLGFIPSLLLGAVGTGGAVVLASTLPLGPFAEGTLVVATSFSTILAGFIILTTRRAAITQVAGYLILENGIYIFGLLLLDALPFLVEVGVLLDLLVAVFVMGIILNHIQAAFSSHDTTRLSLLKE
jgi:hydrogenase-4 component E